MQCSVLYSAFLSVFVLQFINQPATAAKILMSCPSIGSHVLEQLFLGEALVSRGHSVYVTLPQGWKDMKSVESRGVHVITYRWPDDGMCLGSEYMERKLADAIFNSTSETGGNAGEVSFISKLVHEDCSYMMSDSVFLDHVRQMDFDLAIVEPFIICPCYTLLPAVIGIPYISLSLTLLPWDIRSPALPSFYPLTVPWKVDPKMTFYGRMANLMKFVLLHKGIILPEAANTALLKKHLPHVASWKDLILQSQLFLWPTDYRLGYAVPLLPNIIQIPGMNAKPVRPLPQDLERIVSSATHGVILMTFGANAQYIPADIVSKFLEAFGQLNQTVLAKLIVPEGMHVPENVKLMSWMPQNDILGQAKTKLFITHCGNNGQYEALYHGVPMLGMPLFAEQEFNCHRSFLKGFGLQMNIKQFTVEELRDNINEILNNSKYATSVKRASKIWRDEPMSSTDKAIYWVEHVLKFGGEHLRSAAFDMPLYQFLMLDILAVFVFIVLIVVCALKLVCTVICRCVAKKCMVKSMCEKKLKQA